jgi:hypothetical protein
MGWTYRVSGGSKKYIQSFCVEITYTWQSRTDCVGIMGTLWAFVITLMKRLNALEDDRYFLNN